MITIRSPRDSSEVALACLEATVTTPRAVYSIHSDTPMTNSGFPATGVPFGGIAWPRCCFRFPEGLLLEQQMFLPHDGSAVALSWVLRSETAVAAQLVIRPFFSGC